MTRVPPLRPRRSSGLLPACLVLATALLLGFLALPFVALLLRVSPGEVLSRLGDPAVLAALRLSLLTSAAATAIVIVLGLPAAYLLATREFPGKRAVEVLIDLPMVLPPTVAGFALLMAFGRAGLTGGPLEHFGITLPFTTLGVIVAQVFMSAPFFIGPARAGLAAVDHRLIEAAATLGASEAYTLRRVLLPLAGRSLAAGTVMCAARALGEFGATITFAGNLPGTTQTMPLAVYVAMQSDLDAAIVLSVLLLVMALGLLAGLRASPPGSFWARTHARLRPH